MNSKNMLLYIIAVCNLLKKCSSISLLSCLSSVPHSVDWLTSEHPAWPVLTTPSVQDTKISHGLLTQSYAPYTTGQGFKKQCGFILISSQHNGQFATVWYLMLKAKRVSTLARLQYQ